MDSTKKKANLVHWLAKVPRAHVQKYLEHCIVDLHMSYVEAMGAKRLMELFHLKPVFKSYGVVPCYYKDP